MNNNPQNNQQCESYLNHTPVWAGDGYFCSKCMLRFDIFQSRDNQLWEDEFVEKGAALEHARWAGWQNYLHTFLTWNGTAWELPHDKKERWEEQTRTPYSMLSEAEKESDRKEARTYLPLIRSLLAAQHASTCGICHKEIEPGSTASSVHTGCFALLTHNAEVEKLLAERDKSSREEIEKDYIEWVIASSYGRTYKGKTPFWDWKQKAEAKDMDSWK